MAYASRTLTTTDCAYAQIEKEMLAITYACKKFHAYIYGKLTQVETDHKSLESVMKKPLGMVPPRLQRMMLQLKRYELEVCFTPGKTVVAADALSCVQLPNTEEADDELTADAEVMVHALCP